MTDTGEASVGTTESTSTHPGALQPEDATGGSDAWGAFEFVPAAPQGDSADTHDDTGDNSAWSAFDSTPAASTETGHDAEDEQWSAFDSSDSVPVGSGPEHHEEDAPKAAPEGTTPEKHETEDAKEPATHNTTEKTKNDGEQEEEPKAATGGESETQGSAVTESWNAFESTEEKPDGANGSTTTESKEGDE